MDAVKKICDALSLVDYLSWFWWKESAGVESLVFSFNFRDNPSVPEQ